MSDPAKGPMQPTLLDRITENKLIPSASPSARARGPRLALTNEQLRACVIRDVIWLLNTGNLAQSQELEDFPYAAQSVINYGWLELAGESTSNLIQDIYGLERSLATALKNFEPRIKPRTLTLRPPPTIDNPLVFEIEGELYTEPAQRLLMRTEIDLFSGEVAIPDASCRVIE